MMAGSTPTAVNVLHSQNNLNGKMRRIH